MTIQIKQIKKNPLSKHEDIITGLRLIFAITVGPIQTVAKLMAPVPRLAHFASATLNPAVSNIDTE